VLEAQQQIRDEIEREPARFQLRELATGSPGAPPGLPRMRRAAEDIARFVGARQEDLAFVDNATTGANSVLRSFPFAKGDEVLVTDLSYGSVVLAARHIAGERGATVRSIELPFPMRDPMGVVEAYAAGIGPNTRLAIVDHITSESALVMPVREIAAVCHAKGVGVLVDAAHAPGQLDLDIPSLGVDWYTGNLHKWACAPRSCGILWAGPERQKNLHPAVISWGYEKSFLAEFDLIGTRDPSPMLAAPAGIEFMRELGLEAMHAYQRGLAWDAGQRLTAMWGTKLETPRSMVGAMVTVPMPARAGTTPAEIQKLRDALLYEDRIEVQMHVFRGQPWARISAQVYVDMSDIERLGERVLKRIG
jgi:isopenicillin-N epimerase